MAMPMPGRYYSPVAISNCNRTSKPPYVSKGTIELSFTCLRRFSCQASITLLSASFPYLLTSDRAPNNPTMHPTLPILLSSILPLTTSAETVLGVYIFSRRGDRTSKSTPPTNLTTLGYSQIFVSGSYFRSRYVADDASSRILGLSPDIVDYTQISASAPLDTVLMPSAQGFLQGLYPPVGSQLGSLGSETSQKCKRRSTDIN